MTVEAMRITENQRDESRPVAWWIFPTMPLVAAAIAFAWTLRGELLRIYGMTGSAWDLALVQPRARTRPRHPFRAHVRVARRGRKAVAEPRCPLDLFLSRTGRDRPGRLSLLSFPSAGRPPRIALPCPRGF